MAGGHKKGRKRGGGHGDKRTSRSDKDADDFHKRTKGGGGGGRGRGKRGRGGRGGSTSVRGRFLRPSGQPRMTFPGLEDFDESVYVPKAGTSLMDGIRYTIRHEQENKEYSGFRLRPMEFVKSQEKYDPLRDLVQKLKSASLDDDILSEVLDAMEDGLDEEIADEEEGIDLDFDDVDEEIADEEEGIDLDFDEVDEEEIAKLEAFEIQESDVEIEEQLSLTESDSLDPENTVEIAESDDEEGESLYDFEIDNVGDDLTLHEKSKTAKILDIVRSKAAALESIPKKITADIPATTAVEHDPVLTIGNVTLHTRKDSTGNTVANLHTISALNSITTTGFVDENEEENDSGFTLSEDSDNYDDDLIADYIANTRDDTSDDSSDDFTDDSSDAKVGNNSEEGEEDQPYGFLAEDFEFDCSKLKITNVRYGIQNLVYACSEELTCGEFAWIDEADVHTYVLDNGVKEHRLAQFMKYITDGLIDLPKKDKIEEDTLSDVYISPSSSEEDEEDEEDLESIRAMAAFANNTLSRPPEDMLPTRSIRTKGKGRKKMLDVDQLQVELDTETRQSLMDQYQIQKQLKKLRRAQKNQDQLQNGLNKGDLLVKYPYSIRVTEMIEEFDSFLHNANRQSLSFPPLDPHGNKTVSKFAKFYNMRLETCGSGKKLFVKVSKTKKSFTYLPDYSNIKTVLRQRPVFKRTDVKGILRPEIPDNGPEKKSKGPKVSYREGEVVGENAPGIEKDNFGRQLLMKMGWIEGEGLGHESNKGMNEAVIAKFKKTKMGIR